MIAIIIALIILIIFIAYVTGYAPNFTKRETFAIKMQEQVTHNMTIPMSTTVVHRPFIVGAFNPDKYYGWTLVNSKLCYKPIWLHLNTKAGTEGNTYIDYPGRLQPGTYTLIIYEQLYDLLPDRFSSLGCWDLDIVEDKNGLINIEEITFTVTESPMPTNLVPLTRKFSRDFHDSCVGTGDNPCHNVVNSLKIGCVVKEPTATTKPLYRAYAPIAQKTCINALPDEPGKNNIKWNAPPCWDATANDWSITGYIEKEKTRPEMIPIYNAYHKVPNISGAYEGIEVDCGVTPEFPYCYDVPAERWSKLGYIYPANMC